MIAILILVGAALCLFFGLWWVQIGVIEKLRGDLWTREAEVVRLRRSLAEDHPWKAHAERTACPRPYKAVTLQARVSWTNGGLS